MGPRVPCLSIYPHRFTDRIRIVHSTIRDILASASSLLRISTESVDLSNGKVRLLCVSLLYISNLIVDIDTPKAKMQAILLPNSLSELQLHLESSQSLTLATPSQKKKKFKQNRTDRYKETCLHFRRPCPPLKKFHDDIGQPLSIWGLISACFGPHCSRLL